MNIKIVDFKYFFVVVFFFQKRDEHNIRQKEFKYDLFVQFLFVSIYSWISWCTTVPAILAIMEKQGKEKVYLFPIPACSPSPLACCLQIQTFEIIIINIGWNISSYNSLKPPVYIINIYFWIRTIDKILINFYTYVANIMIIKIIGFG